MRILQPEVDQKRFALLNSRIVIVARITPIGPGILLDLKLTNMRRENSS
jgi:hypothetical protein